MLSNGLYGKHTCSMISRIVNHVTVCLFFISEVTMATTTTDSEVKENNLPPWLTPLRAPGVSSDVVIKTYAEWVERGNYDLVRKLSHYLYFDINRVLVLGIEPKRSNKGCDDYQNGFDRVHNVL